MKGFVGIAREAFRYLEDEYGFAMESCSEEDWGGQLAYGNLKHGIGIKLIYEFTSAFVFVFVYRLIDGQMRDNALPITEKSSITCFDFNDVLDEAHKMKPTYEYGENSPYYEQGVGLRNYVVEFANRLRGFGDPILRGDFSVLPQVERIIKERVRRT